MTNQEALDIIEKMAQKFRTNNLELTIMLIKLNEISPELVDKLEVVNSTIRFKREYDNQFYISRNNPVINSTTKVKLNDEFYLRYGMHNIGQYAYIDMNNVYINNLWNDYYQRIIKLGAIDYDIHNTDVIFRLEEYERIINETKKLTDEFVCEVKKQQNELKRQKDLEELERLKKMYEEKQ